MRDTGPQEEAAEDPPRRSISSMLIEISGDVERERISVEDLLVFFGNRAFGALIFVFAAPVALPIAPPGTSGILGAPLMLLTWQLMLGRHHPWLPSFISNRSFARADFARIVGAVGPRLEQLERMTRPRMPALTNDLGKKIIGAVGLMLAIVLSLPIPLGNVLPALALCVLAFALLERDGAAVLVGMAMAVASMVLVTGVIYGLVRAAVFFLRTFVSGG